MNEHHLPIDPDLEPDQQHPTEVVAHHGRTLLLVALGGAFGALMRWSATEVFPTQSSIPWTTMAINVIGAFLLALLLISVLHHRNWWMRPLLGTGVLGGFTTFSAVEIQSRALMSAGDFLPVLIYLALSLIVSLLVVVVTLRVLGE